MKSYTPPKMPSVGIGAPKMPMGLRGGLIHSQFHASVRAAPKLAGRPSFAAPALKATPAFAVPSYKPGSGF